MRLEVSLRDFPDILTVVAALGDGERKTPQLGDACRHACGEVLNLSAGVVVVELSTHSPAGAREQGRDRIAERGLPPVADVERPSRIGGDKLHDDAVADADIRVPVPSAPMDDVQERRIQCARIDAEVDEPWPSYLGGPQPGPSQIEAFDHGSRELACLALEWPCQHHCVVRGPVPERRVARAFDNWFERVRGAELLSHAFELAAEQLRVRHSSCAGFDLAVGAAGVAAEDLSAPLPWSDDPAVGDAPVPSLLPDSPDPRSADEVSLLAVRFAAARSSFLPSLP